MKKFFINTINVVFAIIAGIWSGMVALSKPAHMRMAVLFLCISAIVDIIEGGKVDWHTAWIFFVLPIALYLAGICLAEGAVETIDKAQRKRHEEVVSKIRDVLKD